MASVAELVRAGIQQLSDTSDSARTDVEVLLCHLLKKPRSFLFTWPEHEVSPAQTQQFYDWLTQRCEGQPVAYLIGRRHFYSHEFLVSADTLIPRADTEILVDAVLARLPDKAACRVADLGTGTGAIAISLALARPHWLLEAVDFSVAILDLVQRNVSRLKADNVCILQSNWCARLQGKFDAIVSNPPYIAEDDRHLQQGDVRFEPRSALTAGADGLDDIRIIVEQSKAHLHHKGLLALEHGYDQGEAVREIFSAHGYARIETLLDLGGRDRVTLGYAD
ncbi:MAG: peptide chain release factor N(5)-glutamine methyltransferase [Alcanivoracaceae bacterium]|nr:peptide chain release factor N(5)-glutamine methyltransferase [Alcanivoracaceae bacterium]